MAETRIAVVDDHPLFRSALTRVLQGTSEGLSVIEAATLEELLKHLDDGLEVDLATLDLNLPGVHGLLGLHYLRKSHPEVPVMVVSATTEAEIATKCMMLGASAFVPKSSSAQNLRAAVRAVLSGEVWLPEDAAADSAASAQVKALLSRLASLSSRELQVALKLLEGQLNRQIADELGISEATAKAHVSSILEKLEVGSRTQAVLVLQKIDELV